MLIRTLTFISVFSFLFSACENSTDVDGVPPYQEYTVINARLSAYKVFEGVAITHTLPLGAQYDILKAEIKDAVAYMVKNYTRVIPLHYTSEGIYKPLMNINIEAGQTYEFFAQVNNKSIYSKTVIPDVPSIISVTDAEYQYLNAEVEARPGEAYGAVWIVSAGTNNTIMADDFFSIVSPENYPADVIVRTQNIPDPYNTPAYGDRVYIQVFAFDQSYKDYFVTRTNSDPVNNTFTSGGGTVVWNIAGENVIGLFIGMNESNVVQP